MLCGGDWRCKRLSPNAEADVLGPESNERMSAAVVLTLFRRSKFNVADNVMTTDQLTLDTT